MLGGLSMAVHKRTLEELYETAQKIAGEAHCGQVDKGGKPYICHPLAVAASLEKTEHKIVGLLHDVLEDTTVTAEDLKQYGFPDEIIHSVQVMTKQPGMPYPDYLALVKGDACARCVKIADIRHNMEISRIANPTEKDYLRLEKYKQALIFLLGE